MAKKPPQARLDEQAPWLPPPYELADITAMQALSRGDANADQQKRALKWLIENVADTYGFQYRKDPHDHAFGAGRRWVGQQIVKAIKINVSMLRRNDEIA